MPSAPPLLLISVGNSRTRFALAIDGELQPSHIHPNASGARDIAAAVGELLTDATHSAPVLLASVNNPVAEALTTALEARGLTVTRFGRGRDQAPIPIINALDDDSTVGQDRLLAALGAFSRSGQACIVIDAGTAVTVDFVDGEGIFHGGAIAPGLRMMLTALHEHTAALPHPDRVTLSPDALAARLPPHPPFGKTTTDAMLVGVTAAIQGLAHTLVDRYAEFYTAYPRVVATGGDAPLLFEHNSLVEHIVPDLVLVGMLAAHERILKAGDDEGDD